MTADQLSKSKEMVKEWMGLEYNNRYFRPLLALMAHLGSSAIPGYRYKDYMVNSFKFSERAK